jgi:hypothetical protein
VGFTVNGDFPRFATVELNHSLDFVERDVVSVLESVTSFVQSSHDALGVPVDRSYHGAGRLLSVDVRDGELGAEVDEDLTEETLQVTDDECDAVGVSDLGQTQLLFEGRVQEDDDAETLDEVFRQLFRVGDDRYVRVQLRHTFDACGSAILPDVFLPQEELQKISKLGHRTRVKGVFFFNRSM